MTKSEILQLISPQAVSFSQSIPFDKPHSLMTKSVDAAYTFTPNTTGAVNGNGTELVLVADGTNAPVFSGFQKLSTSDTYSNVAGQEHTILFYKNAAGNYVYSIMRGVLTDLTAPTISSIATTSSTAIQVVFPETVTVTTAGWGYKKNNSALAITSVSGAGTTWTFVVGTMAAGDTLLFSYDATTGNTVDASGNELASITDQSVTNNISVSFTALSFTATTGLVESPTGTWKSNVVDNAYGHTGLASVKLASGATGRIMSSFATTADSSAVFGFKTTNSQGAFATFIVGFVIDTSGVLYRVESSGTLTTTGQTLTACLVSIYRTGSTFKLQKSVDSGANWTDVVTYTATSSADIWPVCDIHGLSGTPGKLLNPKYEGLA